MAKKKQKKKTDSTKKESKPSERKPEVNISDKRKEEILDQIFDQGYATKEVTVAKGRLDIVLKNLSARSQLNSERVQNKNTTAAYALHSYVMRILENVIISKNGKEFEGKEEVKEWLDNLPAPLIDKLSSESRQFEREVKSALDIDSINENFSQEVDQAPDSERLQEESTSEKGEA